MTGVLECHDRERESVIQYLRASRRACCERFGLSADCSVSLPVPSVQFRDNDRARRLLTQPAHYALVPLSTCFLVAVRRQVRGLNEHILKRAA